MKEAFITLLSSENYLDGALALAESYKTYNFKYPFVIAITENIYKSEIIDIIKRSGVIAEVIPTCYYSQKTIDRWKGNPVLNTASKYSLFDLKHYDKLVYLDADMYIVSNIEELMNYPDGSMIYNPNFEETGGDKYGFSGSYVFKPKNHESSFYKVLNENFNMVDGELLGKMWFFVMDSPSHQIPIEYCCGYDWWLFQPDFPAKVLHFSGPKKPWLTQFSLNNIHIKNYYNIIDRIQEYKKAFTWKPILRKSL